MSNPRIAFIDIETSPIVGYTWGMYDTNVLGVVEPVKIMSCAWKWLGEETVNVQALADYPDYIGGVVADRSLVTDVWKVLDEADIVIAHNGDQFDLKVLNARFVYHGLNSPSDYKSVDTLKAARKYFRFQNNSLDELGNYLSEGRKTHNGGFSTWLRCIEGDLEAWKVMKEYNARDVELLERVYLRLRPFIGNHPDLNLLTPMSGKHVHRCGSCQSTDTQKRGFALTKVGRYQRYQCRSCGSWSSGAYERVKT